VKVNIEDISSIKKKLNFEIPETDYKNALEKAYNKLKKTVQIKGFRKGKVPRSILEKYYGGKTSMETISELVDRCYREAVQENSIPAVGMPSISDLKMEENHPITFTAEVEVQPKVEAKGFEGIKLKKNKAEVSESELEAELKALQKAHSQWVPVGPDERASEGHSVTINYQGTVEGKAFEGGEAQNVEVALGLGRYLPEFEKGILGAQKGETTEFEVNFPENYGVESLKNKAAKFRVELLEIKKEELPALDDEFAKDLGTHDTFDKVKEDIKAHLLKGKESQERGDLFKQVLDHLIKKNEFEVPQAMVDRELDFMWKSVLNQLEQQKLTPQQVGITEEDYRGKNKDEALRRIKGFILFDSIAVQNKLEVQEEELNAKLEEIAKGYKQPVEAIKNFYQEQNLIRPLYNQILEEKTLDFILSKAKISEK